VASIRKRNWHTGKGEKRTAWAVDFVDASGNRQRRQFDSRGAADAFRVEIEGQLRTGTFRADAAKVTVKEAADLFLEHCEDRAPNPTRCSREIGAWHPVLAPSLPQSSDGLCCSGSE